MDRYMITNVTGFDFETKVVDSEGKELRKGFKTLFIERSNELPSWLTTVVRDTSFFDHHDESLLEKIKNFRKVNG